MTNSAAAADDLTQDCFLELIRRPGRFDPANGTLRNYLFDIVRNLAVAQAIQSLSVLQREALILFE